MRPRPRSRSSELTYCFSQSPLYPQLLRREASSPISDIPGGEICFSSGWCAVRRLDRQRRGVRIFWYRWKLARKLDVFAYVSSDSQLCSGICPWWPRSFCFPPLLALLSSPLQPPLSPRTELLTHVLLGKAIRFRSCVVAHPLSAGRGFRDLERLLPPLHHLLPPSFPPTGQHPFSPSRNPPQNLCRQSHLELAWRILDSPRGVARLSSVEQARPGSAVGDSRALEGLASYFVPRSSGDNLPSHEGALVQLRSASVPVRCPSAP